MRYFNPYNHMESKEYKSLDEVTRIVTEYKSEANSRTDAIRQIEYEYETTLKTGSEQLCRATRRENNRWRSLLCWLTSRKLAAQRELQSIEGKRDPNPEEHSDCLNLIKSIDQHIEKTQAKCELTRLAVLLE